MEEFFSMNERVTVVVIKGYRIKIAKLRLITQSAIPVGVKFMKLSWKTREIIGKHRNIKVSRTVKEIELAVLSKVINRSQVRTHIRKKLVPTIWKRLKKY